MTFRTFTQDIRTLVLWTKTDLIYWSEADWIITEVLQIHIIHKQFINISLNRYFFSLTISLPPSLPIFLTSFISLSICSLSLWLTSPTDSSFSHQASCSCWLLLSSPLIGSCKSAHEYEWHNVVFQIWHLFVVEIVMIHVSATSFSALNVMLLKLQAVMAKTSPLKFFTLTIGCPDSY